MNISVEYLRSFSSWLWAASWQSTLLAALILIVQWILKKQLSARWRNALWLLVLARLFLPSLPHARFSAYNWLPRKPAVSLPAMTSRPAFPVPPYRAPSVAPRDAEPSMTSNVPIRSILALRTFTESHDPSPSIPMLPLVWMAGFLIITVRTTIGYLRLRRKVEQLRTDAPPILKQQFNSAKADLRVSRAELVVSEAVGAPCVTGLWRSRVILPMGLEEKLSPEDVRMVLLHELAHIKRGDLWLAWLSWLAAALHWFNPGIRFALAWARKDREMACDEWVLRFVTDSRAYGAALIRFMESQPLPQSHLGAIGIFESKSALFQRVSRIAAYRQPTFIASAIGFAVLVTLALFTLTDASDPKPQATPIALSAGSPLAPATIEQDRAKILEAVKYAAHARQSTGITVETSYPKDQNKPSVQLEAPSYHLVLEDKANAPAESFLTNFRPTGYKTNDELAVLFQIAGFAYHAAFLYKAIEDGDSTFVRNLINDGASPNIPQNNDSSLFEPIEAAVNSLVRKPDDDERRKIVKMLLEYRGGYYRKGVNNRFLLLVPVSNNMVDLVQFLLKAGVEPRQDPDGGRAVSEEAERHGSQEMKDLVRTALEKGEELVVVLDAEAAARLAASLANSEAKRQFDTTPFNRLQSAPTLSKGRWHWQATVGYGKGDLQSIVSFTQNGAKPEVQLKVLILEAPILRATEPQYSRP